MTSEAPQKIGLISNGLGQWALATVDEADHAVKYIPEGHALAMVAAEREKARREAGVGDQAD